MHCDYRLRYAYPIVEEIGKVTAMSGDTETLKLLEVLLTAEVFNQHPHLDINDMTPLCRQIFGFDGSAEIRRPLYLSEGMIRKHLGIQDARERLKENPVVVYEEFGQRFRITSLGPAAKWFINSGGKDLAEKNPALAYFFEQSDSIGISYKAARASNPLYEDTRAYLDGKVSNIIAEDERLRSGLDLIIINAPEEVEQQMSDLVFTETQRDIIARVQTARAHLEFLRKHRIHEVGKLLFVGPPGTGKTSLALAMSHEMHMPILEVRLSMVTSQYLGETSKNIDRIFEFAKKMAPCILFIDEFDYVAKSRVTDDHGAMKRAVNSLLKNIDKINLVKNGLLLIAATNHPQLLDEAAWRRFDEVIPFNLPDENMREEILRKITESLPCRCDYHELAARTQGFSGSDLRMMIKEAILVALMKGRTDVTQEEIEQGIIMVCDRETIRHMNWL